MSSGHIYNSSQKSLATIIKVAYLLMQCSEIIETVRDSPGEHFIDLRDDLHLKNLYDFSFVRTECSLTYCLSLNLKVSNHSEGEYALLNLCQKFRTTEIIYHLRRLLRMLVPGLLTWIGHVYARITAN